MQKSTKSRHSTTKNKTQRKSPTKLITSSPSTRRGPRVTKKRSMTTIVVPGQAPFQAKLTQEEKMAKVSALHSIPVSPATLNPDPCHQFLQWFKDVASVEPIMPERMTVGTIRRVNNVLYPSSRPVLLKEILLPDQMVSPYTLLTPPDEGAAPTTAAAIAKRANTKTTAEFFPPTSPSTDVITGTNIPYPSIISSSITNAGGAFTFVSNYLSDKGKQIDSFRLDGAANSNDPLVYGSGASLTFHWVELERVVRIEGLIYRGPEALSDLYHTQRPRASQVSAVSSSQTQPLSSHDEIVSRYNEIDELLKQGRYDEIETVGLKREGKKPLVPDKLPNGEIDPLWVPRPDQWGAFVVVPQRFEFWQGKPSRFHERVVYTPKGDVSVAESNGKVEWEMTLLQP